MSHTSYTRIINSIRVNFVNCLSDGSNGHRKINECARTLRNCLLFFRQQQPPRTHTTAHTLARLVHFSGNHWITCNDSIDNCADEPNLLVAVFVCVYVYVYVYKFICVYTVHVFSLFCSRFSFILIIIYYCWTKSSTIFFCIPNIVIRIFFHFVTINLNLSYNVDQSFAFTHSI